MYKKNNKYTTWERKETKKKRVKIGHLILPENGGALTL